MISWTASDISEILGTRVDVPGTFKAVCTDTRLMQTDALFVALVGERFDGHQFLEDAIRGGAKAAVVNRDTTPMEGIPFFQVDDTLEALGRLARARRRQIVGPVVAVTGTNGKTSTKELLGIAIGTRWKSHYTRENLNNLIGVPLTILDAPLECEALVVEAGASELGEIAKLRDIVEPTVAVVTNVSPAHLDGFGSFEGVLAEKTSLLRDVPTCVVGTDPAALLDKAWELTKEVVSAGLSESANVRPDSWQLDELGRGTLSFKGVSYELPLVGKHQLENLMLVLAVASSLDLDLGSVASALLNVNLPAGRCEVLANGAMTIIKDSYNANPSSFKAALETASVLRGKRDFVVVLGTMLELGDDSAELHSKIAAAVMASNPKLVGVLGEFVRAFEPYAQELGDRLVIATESDTLGRRVARRLSGNELVLVKGSRGVRLERAIPFLLSNKET